MVRSPKSIAGAVEVALGNAPYKIAAKNAQNFLVAPQVFLNYQN
ncbi:MAG: hypothetical protein ACKPI8_02040 [Microcystis panniformis]